MPRYTIADVFEALFRIQLAQGDLVIPKNGQSIKPGERTNPEGKPVEIFSFFPFRIASTSCFGRIWSLWSCDTAPPSTNRTNKLASCTSRTEESFQLSSPWQMETRSKQVSWESRVCLAFLGQSA